jgi:hypothetical protein
MILTAWQIKSSSCDLSKLPRWSFIGVATGLVGMHIGRRHRRDWAAPPLMIDGSFQRGKFPLAKLKGVMPQHSRSIMNSCRPSHCAVGMQVLALGLTWRVEIVCRQRIIQAAVHHVP